MKRITTLIALLSIFISSSGSYVHAASPTPTVKPTSESVTENLSDQINTLKEKIASRVAQLNLVEKRGILGTVKEADDTAITLTDIYNKNRLIDVDEITKFTSSSANDSFGISDIKPGEKLSVIGLYNKDSQRLLARFIGTTTVPVYLSGTVKGTNGEEFTATVTTEGQKDYIIDVENVTRTIEYTGEESKRAGFSKIETGTRVMVIGYSDLKEKDRVTATRILLFPELPRNPKIVVTGNTNNEETTPSTGSGRTLTPLR